MMTVYWPNGTKLHSLEDWMFDCLSGEELLKRHIEYYDRTYKWGFFVSLNSISYITGDPKDVKHLLLNHHIRADIGRIKKHWYWMYCEAHGYIVMENYMTLLEKTQIIINSPRADMILYNYKR